MTIPQFLKVSKHRKKTSEKIDLFRLAIFSLLQENRIRIYGQFKGTSGRALIRERKVKIPDPINEMSFLTCLHEIGHVVTNKISDPSWMKEYLAVKYSIDGALKLYPQINPKYLEYQKRYLIMKMCMSVRRSHDPNKIWDEVWKFVNQNKERWIEMIRQNTYPLVYTKGGSWKNTSIVWLEKITGKSIHTDQLVEM